jgi:hypothetical protein
MDEEMEDAAAGKSTDLIADALKDQAAALVAKFGKVSKKEWQKRREEDKVVVEESVEKAMKHWMDFFRNNPKYWEVGKVVGRKELPEDGEEVGLCEEALKKRPIKGGSLRKCWGRPWGWG